MEFCVYVCIGDQGENRPVFPESGRGVDAEVPQPGQTDPHGFRLYHLYQGSIVDSECKLIQVEITEKKLVQNSILCMEKTIVASLN